jgi:uncharacterized membrane protein YbhN (UPF0104 family)
VEAIGYIIVALVRADSGDRLLDYVPPWIMKTRTSASLSLSQVVSGFVGFVLFGLAIWTISQTLRQYPPREVIQSLNAIPDQSLILAIACMVMNYIVLAGYDLLAMRYLRHSLAPQKTILVGFVSYAISNNVGFALLSGSAIRYHFYSRWGLSKIQIAQIVAFCHLNFWIGLFTVGGVLFMIEPLQFPPWLHLPFSVQSIGAIFLAIVFSYFFWNLLSHRKSFRIGRWTIPHLSWQLSLTQILITSIDWGLAAGVLYLLLPQSTSLSYPGFFGIYLVAKVSGLISNVPGGLGVFETMLLLLLSPAIASAELLGALLAYRGIYYFLPFLVAIALLSLNKLCQQFERTP